MLYKLRIRVVMQNRYLVIVLGVRLLGHTARPQTTGRYTYTSTGVCTYTASSTAGAGGIARVLSKCGIMPA